MSHHVPMCSLDGHSVLGLFARCPVKGQVKTRLSAVLSEDFTLSLYKAFIKDIYRQVCRIANVYDAHHVKKALFFSSADYKNKNKNLLQEIIKEDTDFPWFKQEEGNLGKKITHFFRWAFNNGFNQAVLIGSDAPTLPDSYIIQALNWLASKDENSPSLVIGPSTDGGYYLVGMSKLKLKPYNFNIFSGISWGTNKVLAETISRITENFRFRFLPPWYDVDEVQSFQFMKTHLKGLLNSGEALALLPENTINLLDF